MRTMQKLRTLILAGGVLALAGTAAMAEDSYKIGVSEPLSGAASSLGVPVVESVKAAAEVINANGGINGRKIELVIRDDQSKPDIAVQNFRRLSEEGVYAMIGPNQGSNTLAVSASAPTPMATEAPSLAGKMSCSGLGGVGMSPRLICNSS